MVYSVPTFSFIRVPITNLIPSYDSRQGRPRQVPVGRFWRAVAVQGILDRADVGRATFYSHFKSKDELLTSGAQELRNALNSAVQGERSSSESHEVVVGFSRGMFEHANEYREVYRGLLHTQGWPVFRKHLKEILDEIIRRECKAEIKS